MLSLQQPKRTAQGIRKLKITTWVGYLASVSEPHTDMRYVSHVHLHVSFVLPYIQSLPDNLKFVSSVNSDYVYLQ